MAAAGIRNRRQKAKEVQEYTSIMASPCFRGRNGYDEPRPPDRELGLKAEIHQQADNTP